MNLERFNTSFGIYNVLKNDDAFIGSFRQGKIWEESLIKKVLEKIPDNGIILDIGAHIGTHSIPYAIFKKNTHILSFEPQEKIRDILKMNIKENNLSNITAIPFGIAHKNQEVRLANDFTSDGYSPDLKVDYNSLNSMNFGGIGITNDKDGELINIVTIDYLKPVNVTYMKIDVEGAETLVIFGAQETIKKYKPILLIEQSDKNLTHLYIKDTPELAYFSVDIFLFSLGYTKIALDNSNNLFI